MDRVIAIVGPLVAEALAAIEDDQERVMVEAHLCTAMARVPKWAPRLGAGVSQPAVAAAELAQLMVDLALAARGPRAAARRLGITYSALKAHRRRQRG